MLSKPVPLTILLSLSVAISVTATVAAASTGALNFFGIGPTNVEPIINGTIINNDNKTYGILIVPTGNVTIPPVVIPPVVNDTQPPVVNDTQPPVVNDTQPPAKDLKVIVVGDIADTTSGNKVYNAIKNQNADYVFVLGDLGYSSSLKWFKSTYGTSEKVYCVVGNHEADNEDGSAALEQETKQFCGNSYWIKNGATLFVMLNTNDPNLSALADKTGKVFQNSTIMSGVKTVHIMSHKPCAVPPNSHHPLEIKGLCDAIKSKIPSGLKVFYNQAHNHVMSESSDGTYKQSGAGGKSHYTCGTSTAFPFCNAGSYGYLQYIIKPDGTSTSSFIDYNGVVKK